MYTSLRPGLWALLLVFCWMLPVRVAAQSARSADLYVLSIGVSQYPNLRDSRWQLRFADDDATSIVRWAETQQGHLYRRVTTRLLLNAQATRAGVISALLEMLKGVGPDDQVIVYLAGHGLVESVTQKYHYLTYDTELSADAALSNDTRLAATALSQSDLLGTIEQASRLSRRVLLVLDTCQSGALSSTGHGSGERGLTTVQETSPSPLDEKARVNAILTAGTAADKAAEGPQYRLEGEKSDIEGHGVFTWALLSGLSTGQADANRNGLIFLGELWSYVSDKVREETGGKQLPENSGRQADIPVAWVPGTREVCDARDNDLDGQIDEGWDENGDGKLTLDESFDKNQNQLADCLEKERCNGVDDNGNGVIDEGFDQDGDGHRSMQLCGSRFGDDSDDRDYAIHPDQKDWGNLRDDDGDGFTDEDSPSERWNPSVPDSIEKAAFRSDGQFWTSLAGSAISGGFGLFLLLQLPALERSIQEDFYIDEHEENAYRDQLMQGLGLTGLGMIGLGVSGTFAWDGYRIRTQLFPPVRKLVSTSAPAHEAVKKGGNP